MVFEQACKQSTQQSSVGQRVSQAASAHLRPVFSLLPTKRAALPTSNQQEQQLCSLPDQEVMQQAALTKVRKASNATQLGENCGNAARRMGECVQTIKKSIEDVCNLYSNVADERQKQNVLLEFKAGLVETGQNADKYMTTVNQICKKGFLLIHTDPHKNKLANQALVPAQRPNEEPTDPTADLVIALMGESVHMAFDQGSIPHVNDEAARSASQAGSQNADDWNKEALGSLLSLTSSDSKCAIEVCSNSSSAVASSEGEVDGGKNSKLLAPMASTALRASKRRKSENIVVLLSDAESVSNHDSTEVEGTSGRGAGASSTKDAPITTDDSKMQATPQTTPAASSGSASSDHDSASGSTDDAISGAEESQAAAQKPAASRARKPAVARKSAAHHHQNPPVRQKNVNPAPSAAETAAIAAPRRCQNPDVRKYTCSIDVVMCLLDTNFEWNKGHNSAVRTSARTNLLCIFQSSTKPTSPAGTCFVKCG